MTDDQRPDTLEVMPGTRDFFVDAGVTFTNAFATTPLCCPSRASLFTGMYAHNHRVFKNRDSHDLETASTIQYHLRQAGYRTALVGKYLNSWTVEEDPPLFDRWASYSGRYYHRPFNVDGETINTEKYSTYFMADKAEEFISGFEDVDTQPWFLYVATVAPHSPFTPAPHHRGASLPSWQRNPAIDESDLSDKPDGYDPRPFTLPDTEKVRKKQLRTLLAVDDLVERLEARLIATGEINDTLAIFTSDQGLMWGEHGHFGKRLPYTQSVAAPLMLRWPGHVGTAASDKLVANVDIAPTILEAAGLEADGDAGFDGRSLLGAEERSEVFLEQLENWRVGLPDWRSIRTPSLQYIEYYRRDGTLLEREYYDLREDPWQLHNLLGDPSTTNDPNVADLSSRMRAYAQCAGDPCFREASP